MRFMATKTTATTGSFQNAAHRSTASKLNFSRHVRETFDEIQNLTDRVQPTGRVDTAPQFNSHEEENHG